MLFKPSKQLRILSVLVALAPIFAASCVAPARARTARTGGDASELRASAGTIADSIAWPTVDAAMGRAGIIQPGDVHRFNFPRGDLRVMIGEIQVKSALALGGWLAMKAVGGDVVAMGDLVLLENELAPVITRLQQGGVEQTAVHHHLLHETPRIFYMHVHAHGDPVKIAQAVRAAVALTKAPAATPSATPAAIDMDTAKVAMALGYAGRINGGVYQVSVPRAESIRDGLFDVPSSMGLGTAINFQPTGGGKAAITGDFVLRAAEVNPVIRSLRDGGIEVTALHNHMLNDEPRLFFMHFWANDDATTLARTLRVALEQTNSKRPTM